MNSIGGCIYFDENRMIILIIDEKERIMMNRKIALILAGLLAANVAIAAPGEPQAAPQSSVATCVAAVAENADYAEATVVKHNVETEERRVSGHKMSIRTTVLDERDTVIREYASFCAIDNDDEIRRFRIRQAD